MVDAPITWLGEVRGVLGVCSREAGHFDSTDLEILDTFARLASLALHNAESFETHERQVQVQRGFYRVAEVLGSTLSLGETLDAFAQAACDALGGGAAFVLEPDGEDVAVAGSHGLPETLHETLAAGLGEEAAPCSRPRARNGVIASTSIADDDRFDEGLRKILRQSRLPLAPLRARRGGPGRGDSVVVLFADERTFSDDDLAVARHLTGAAKGALERSELFEAERRARSFSQRLAAVSGLLATKLEPEVALAAVAREAPALLGADAGAVRLLEHDELVVRAAFGEGAKSLVGRRSSSADGVAGAVAQSRSPLAVSDARETPRFAREDAFIENEMVSAVSAPMIVHGGTLYGVLTVYAARPRVWHEDEVQALIALAATASAALSSADLYQRVAEEKERSEAILAHIADGIVAIDREGSIVLWNAMAEHITGVPAEEALGRRVAEVLQRELATSGADAPGQREVSIVRGGKDVWLSLTEAVMLDPAGSVAGRIFAFRDVSSERVVEQMKSDFVATVSHELRTPLTSIYGFAETLLRGDVDFSEAERSTFLSYIASESERLIRIADDLLNVARLETGMLGLNVTSTDVGDVIEDVVTRLRGQVDGRHTFSVEVHRGDLAVRADREKLRQVLANLVDNAVKFSPSGGQITVSARRRTDTAEVRVIDEGVGIARADQQRIFTKFHRAGAAETRRARRRPRALPRARPLGRDGRPHLGRVEGGRGLELRLRVADCGERAGRRGRGDRRRGCRRARSPPKEVERTDMKVLVIDDEAPIRLLCRVNLEAEGIEVAEAGDGEQGLELARSESPDAILLDVMLPGLHGWAVAERLLEDEKTSGIPVIFLTARGPTCATARAGWTSVGSTT